MSMPNEVLVKFENEDQAEAFIAWFSKRGEDRYFEDIPDEDPLDDYVDNFDYDFENFIINGNTDTID